MGRKVHPYGFRLGYIKDWKARWYAEKEEYADLLAEDLKIRKLIRDELGQSMLESFGVFRYPERMEAQIEVIERAEHNLAVRGSATSIEATTWGRVKATYRQGRTENAGE